MARSTRSAALATLIVLGVGCGNAVSSTSRSFSRDAPTTKSNETVTERSKAVPLMLEAGMPTHLPEVELTLDAGTHQVTQKGVVFTYNWSTRRGIDWKDTHYPVQWPKLATIDTAYSATLAFNTPVAPEWVVVKAYTRVDRDSRVPAMRPIASFECLRFTEPRCKVAKTASGIRIQGLGRNILAGAYLVVYCTWHVPLEQQRTDSETPDDVVASWLFHINDVDRLRAPQP